MRKRFGQHFLIDIFIIDQIIEAISPKTNDHLIEIGPGNGALTKPLLNTSTRFDVIEIDRDLIPLLQQFSQSLQIHQSDVLKFNFNELYQGQKFRLIGNLPYNISTPLLFYLLNYIDHIQDMHFMLQQEVADRLVAKPNDKAYGRLGIMLQYYFSMEKLFTVPPDAFDPPPKVFSAVVRFIPHFKKSKIAKNEKILAEIIKAAFSKRRKIIKNALSDFFSNEDFQKIGINPTQRPEELSLENYVALANLSK